MTTDTSFRTVDELGNGTLQIWDLPIDTDTLLGIITDVFTEHWRQIGFGVLVQGAAWEVAAPNAPRKIAMYDGYVTVDFGSWHFHSQDCGAQWSSPARYVAISCWAACSRVSCGRSSLAFAPGPEFRNSALLPAVQS